MNEELLSSDSSDAVYIGLVNSVHYEYACKALKYGRHVILEKPLVSTLREAWQLAALAHQKKLYVLEAITVIRSRVFCKMEERMPKLGRIRLFQANYSQYSSRCSI